MIILYICEICGYRSKNREVIKKCEAQGKNPLYSKGQTAILAYGDVTEKRPMVEIDRVVGYREESHLPIYKVEFPPEHRELSKVIDIVPQDWLQPT